MAKNTSITLGYRFDQFINQQLHSGRYGSASEVLDNVIFHTLS